MYYLLYLSIGKKTYLRKQLIYSLFSLSEVSGDWTKEHVKILVYSDDTLDLPEELAHLDVRTRLLSQLEISEWVGNSNNFFLVLKARILQDFFKEYTAHALLVDTDTFFIQDPKALFMQLEQGKSILHLQEHQLAQRSMMAAYLKNKRFRSVHGDTYQIDTQYGMWNSGVVGLDSSSLARTDEIVYLIEQISEDHRWHVIEQVAFSYFLQKDRPVFSADKHIVHYYFFKHFRYVLAIYFNHFYQDDVVAVREVIRRRVVPQHTSCRELPVLLMGELKAFSQIQEWHFYCLPSNTYIGNLLRKTLMTDIKSFFFVLRMHVKSILKSHKIQEFQLKVAAASTKKELSQP